MLQKKNNKNRLNKNTFRNVVTYIIFIRGNARSQDQGDEFTHEFAVK